jgi:hypothetical protein
MYLVQCDVDGCEAVTPCVEHFGQYNPPRGWRSETFEARNPSGFGSIPGMPVSVHRHACGAHPTLKWKNDPDVESEDAEPVGSPPEWVEELRKKIFGSK